MRSHPTDNPTFFTQNGFTYVRREDGRLFQVPSGGNPEGDTPPAGDTGGEGGGGAGGGDGGGGGETRVRWDAIDWDGPGAPKLNEKNLPKPIQEVLNRHLARERREHEQRTGQVSEQLRAEAERRQGLEAKLSEVEAAIAALKGPPPDEKDPLKPPADIAKHPHLAEAWIETRKMLLEAQQKGGAAEALVAELKNELKALRDDLGKERETRSATEQKAINARRDREVLAVLADLDAIEPKRILRLYTDRVEYHPDTDSFLYRTENDELVALEDGLAADLPAHFVRATTTTGGSGAHGGNGTVRKPAGGKPAEDPIEAQRTKLTQERAALQQKRATAGRLTPADHARLVTIGRELDQLVAQA